MVPGSTFLRVVTRLIPARNVVGHAPDFGTTGEFGSPMDFSLARRAVYVYVASKGKAGRSRLVAVAPVEVMDSNHEQDHRHLPSGPRPGDALNSQRSRRCVLLHRQQPQVHHRLRAGRDGVARELL